MLKKVQMNKDRSKNAHLGERFFCEGGSVRGRLVERKLEVTDRSWKVTDRVPIVADRPEKSRITCSK
ncbi:MAG TPA: hypothetical protein DDY89_09615 [Lysinibacillus sp.]|nr:hypothetical protein [Lysinibacillus sp.]